MATRSLAVLLEPELHGMSMGLGRPVFARSSKRPRGRSCSEARTFWYVGVILKLGRNKDRTAADTYPS